jgi:hypothetical protein
MSLLLGLHQQLLDVSPPDFEVTNQKGLNCFFFNWFKSFILLIICYFLVNETKQFIKMSLS